MQNISWSKFEPIMEASMEDSDINSQSPDILIINRKKGVIQIIIEICRTKQLTKDIKKVKDLIKSFAGIDEAFIYDYEQDEWYKFNDEGEDIYNATFSDVLGKDLEDYVLISKRGVSF